VTWKRWKAGATAIGLALATLAVAGCGSDDEETTTTPPPPVSAATADRLAKLSNRIATNLDAGLTCDAAIAADQLMAAVEEADLAGTLRSGVEEVATRLVNEVNCPPPPPPPEPETETKEDEEKKAEEEKKGEEEKTGEETKEEQSGDQNGTGEEVGPPNAGGIPPGEAKLKGEQG
jgi:hypothetical protein